VVTAPGVSVPAGAVEAAETVGVAPAEVVFG